MHIWKFKASFPCSSTKANSSFLINQKIKGPRILPKGMPITGQVYYM